MVPGLNLAARLLTRRKHHCGAVKNPLTARVDNCSWLTLRRHGVDEGRGTDGPVPRQVGLACPCRAYLSAESPQHSQLSQMYGARRIACRYLFEKEVTTLIDDYGPAGRCQGRSSAAAGT